MSDAVLSRNEELLDLSARLMREYTGVPAGAVLRCVARATRRAMLWGCPSQYLVTTVEASARWCLAETRSYPELV